jgi:hypothetical protein
MECRFTIGQKVVCIDNSGPGRSYLELGHIYTVDGFIEGQKDLQKGMIFITLAETPVGPCTCQGGNSVCPVWNPRRFKPLEDKKTDISAFKKMERPNKPKPAPIEPVKKKEIEKV